MSQRRWITAERALRLLAPAAVALLTAVLAGLYSSGRWDAYEALLKAWGVAPFRFPFLDAKVALAAAECHAAGLDVYVANPCDPLGRLQFYSPIIPRLSAVGLHRLDLNLLGLGLIGLYAAAVWIIFRPKGAVSAAVTLVAVLSYATVFGLERGQLEVLILFCAVMLWVLLARGPAGRLAGYGFALAAGLLKLFPMALFALLVREKLWRALLIGTVALLCFAAVVAGFAQEYQRLTANIVRCGHYCDQYWVGSLVLRFTELDRGSPAALRLWIGAVAVFAVSAGAIANLLHRRGFRPTPADREAVLLTIGALLAVSSYLAESNTDYRAMHLLLAIPFLLRVSARGSAARGWSIAMIAGLLLILWMGPLIRAALPLAEAVVPNPFHAHQAVYLGRDLVWFASMAGLAGIAVQTLMSIGRPLLETVLRRPLAEQP